MYFKALFESISSIHFSYYKDFLIFECPSKCIFISVGLGWQTLLNDMVQSSLEEDSSCIQHCSVVRENQKVMMYRLYNCAIKVLPPST